MVESLRDLLLKSGIVQQVREEKRGNANREAQPRSSAESRRGPATKRQASKPTAGSEDEINLAKAYALRAQTEANERKRAEQVAAEQARLKRERKAKLQQLLQGKVLNRPDADQARHFEYGGKIRRVYVDATQLRQLNSGELGVVQWSGRYVLVTREIAEQVRVTDASLVALLVTAGEGGIGEDGVPDDLMW